jgi:hypothetical protein
MADLYRLVSLVPRCVARKEDADLARQPKRTFAGRYLLHVYTGEAFQHLSLNYRDGSEREWLGALLEEGSWTVTGLTTGHEPNSVAKHVGADLADIEIDYSCTTHVLNPLLGGDALSYTCVLNRFNSFRVRLKDAYWGVSTTRDIESSHENDREAHELISEHVGMRIGLKDDSEEAAPLPVNADLDGSEDDGDDE